MTGPLRELSRLERAEIRKLVVESCANYDGQEKLCRPLDCSCYMLQNGGPAHCAGISGRLCFRLIRHWNLQLPGRILP